MAPMISQAAVDLIVSAEVSSKSWYENKYEHPEWPGGASGITVAIGYDLGYCTISKLHADWDGQIPDAMVKVMERCVGVHGAEAKSLLPSVRPLISIPWEAAMEVFLHRDVPQWTDAVCRSIPAAAALTADCLGALVSLAYNRGASFDAAGDRYREMRDIKSQTQAGRPQPDPTDLRSMKRLWPDMHGLQVRREAEAQLFEKGLTTPSAAPTAHSANPAPPSLPPPPAGAKEHGGAGGALVATGSAANDAIHGGWSTPEIVLVVVAGVVISVAIWFAIRQWRRSQPVTARVKDIPIAATAQGA